MPAKGQHHTPAARVKIADALQGNRNGLGNQNHLGYKHSVASRAKMSAAKVGQPPRPWKSRRFTDDQGYVYIKIPPGHPFISMCRSDGYLSEHRLTMAEHLGRPLWRQEIVHHKNLIKTDNRLGNLELKNRHTHGPSHDFEGMPCFHCGKRPNEPIVQAPEEALMGLRLPRDTDVSLYPALSLA